MGPELAFAHRLADEADRVSMQHFRDEELLLTTKGDGTPVSVVDQSVEKAMARIVLTDRFDDAILGEELGEIPGATSGRWVFDGIDGTHNYGHGRKGWATIVAYERAGEPVIGVVSAPALGRRWWAERGRGAWAAPLGRHGVDFAAAAAIAVASGERREGGASVAVIPWEGFLEGWRSEVATRFVPPETPRSQCFALDAVMVAEGTYDAAVVLMGGRWDFAATLVIVEEAGGRFADAWGGRRLDTASAAYSAPWATAIVEPVLAELRPADPDEPVIRTTTLKPVPKDWTELGIRALPSMSARTRVEHGPPMIMDLVEERLAELRRPFVGVTSEGAVRRGLRDRFSGPKVPTSAITEAAQAFLQALAPLERAAATKPMHSDEWRQWINVHMNFARHGVLLEDLGAPQRDLALGIVRATMSARGYDHARSIMRINELAAELTGDRDAFGEWPYFVSIFGAPGGGEPWGWQIDGHHLCVNCVVLDDRIVTTPSFLGAEPRRIDHGPLAGTSLFDPEEQLAVDLIRALDDAQRAEAIQHPSLHPDLLPAHLQHAFDGRIAAGAFHDNAVLPYQGVQGGSMTDAQRRVLARLAGTYVGWIADDHAAPRLAEVTAHLDETWFSWIGGFDDDAPFYYRLHSPVLLVEFDHHPGVVFDNEIPTRHHVHTVVRTPNGGDYGADLLAQHYERYGHDGGDHRN